MIKENALHYLGIHNKQIDENLNTLIDTCIEEVKEIAKPQFMAKKFSLLQQPFSIQDTNISLDYSDLKDMLEGCNEIYIVACTLGVSIDQRIRYLSISDMSKMVVFDAVSSAYIEEVCDAYEKKLNMNKRTMRYCPGYGNVPISLNKTLASLLSCDKHIGLHISNDLLLPQKSMIGMIGIGVDKHKKTCGHCINIKNCEYLKNGKKCYME